MSISPITSYSAAPYVASTAGSGSTSSPVVASTDPGLAQQASALSTTSGIVATLGSASGTSAQVYDAAGLYNSIAQAGTSTTTTSDTSTAAGSGTTGSGTTTTSSGNAAVAAQESLNSAILSSLPGSSVNTGFYDGTGVLQSTSAGSTNLTANWASALQSNPSLSHTVAADSFAQGIIGTLSVTV